MNTKKVLALATIALALIVGVVALHYTYQNFNRAQRVHSLKTQSIKEVASNENAPLYSKMGFTIEEAKGTMKVGPKDFPVAIVRPDVGGGLVKVLLLFEPDEEGSASSVSIRLEKGNHYIGQWTGNLVVVSHENNPAGLHIDSSFPTKVDYGLSFAEAVRAGRYHREDLTTGEHLKNYTWLPLLKKTGVESVNIELVHFERSMTRKEVLEVFEQCDLRPANYRELLAFGAQYPDVQRAYFILALGSFLRFKGEQKTDCILGIHGVFFRKPWRFIGLQSVWRRDEDGGWPPYEARFLAVPIHEVGEMDAVDIPPASVKVIRAKE